MSDLCGLIPAAGKGTRAYPYTKKTPKSMLEINGEPNLLRNIVLMRDELNISKIYIVVGHQGDVIRERMGDGSGLGVHITYIQNDCIEKGLAYSILLGRKHIKDYFVVILSDECYVDSNHNEILSLDYRSFPATISIMEVDNKELIKRNYSVEMQDGKVLRLLEKPTETRNNILGCGTFVFHPRVFQAIEDAFNSTEGGAVDLITVLNGLCARGENVGAFQLQGRYVNINDRDSLQLAKYYVRDQQFDGCVTTLLIYSEGNEKDIGFTINQYRKSGHIDLIYVLLPHECAVEDEVRDCGVEIIKCPPGIDDYGEKITYGLERVPGDIFILTEADYSFSYRDLSKLMVYIKEADMVIGTRTTRQLIRQRSHMRGIVRMANIMLAKLMELLCWKHECRFTDVGCTFRAVWESTFRKIRVNLVTPGPEFSVEMILEILRARDRIIEIPVNYYGKSYSLYRKYQNIYTFFKMLYVICQRSLKSHLRD
jgi:dTDP-glucose pyrophosphorylase